MTNAACENGQRLDVLAEWSRATVDQIGVRNYFAVKAFVERLVAELGPDLATVWFAECTTQPDAAVVFLSPQRMRRLADVVRTEFGADDVAPEVAVYAQSRRLDADLCELVRRRVRGEIGGRAYVEALNENLRARGRRSYDGYTYRVLPGGMEAREYPVHPCIVADCVDLLPDDWWRHWEEKGVDVADAVRRAYMARGETGDLGLELIAGDISNTA